MKLPIPDSLPDWERELEELVSAQLREDITKEQHERLSEMLRSHSFVRKAYLRRMQLEAMLDWEYAGLSDTDTDDIADERQAQFEQNQQKTWIRWVAPTAIAAMLALGLYFGFHTPEETPITLPYTAKVVHTDIDQWQRGESSPQSGQVLESDRPVSLHGGTATVDFHNGTRATVEGPARFTPIGKDKARLTSGSLSLRTPYGDKLFTLYLPNRSALEIGGGSSLAVTGSDTDQARIYLLAGHASLRLKDGRLRVLNPQMALDFDGLTHSGYIYQPELAPPPPALALDNTFFKRTWIDQLDLRLAEQGWGKTRSLCSVDGGPIRIAEKTFSRGFGTHAQGHIKLALPAGSMRLIAHVGKDDELKGGSVRFMVLHEGKEIWRSDIMRHGDDPKRIDLDISGMRTITLVSDQAGDGIGADHADWANACIIHRGAAPQIIPYQPNLDSFVLTPEPAPEPRINGARVVGIQPQTPFHFKIPVTGKKPITYSAENLPTGLQLDPQTGIITGYLKSKGSHLVTVKAKNQLGDATRTLRIECGNTLALTPPMGWNSWHCWGPDINEQRFRAAAKAIVKHGLVDYGWSYVNMDDSWQGARGGQFNALQANSKFTDMKKLCTDLHNMGLKTGIFTTMNISSPSGFIGSSAVAANGNAGNMAVPIAGRSNTSQVYGDNPDDSLTTRTGPYVFLDQDALQWAHWGFDLVKINGGDNIIDGMQRVRSALDATGRSIVYMANNTIGKKSPHLMAGQAQIWAAQGDGSDNWDHISYTIKNAPKWQSHTRPGSWPFQGFVQLGPTPSPDPNRRSSRRCRLTPAEQYTHFTSLCMMSAPLILSCDLENLDNFTLGLLKNAEVIEVNQDALGKAATQAPGNPSIWIKPMEDGSSVIALFNLTKSSQTITADLKALGLSGTQRVRDLWRQQDQRDASGSLSAVVEPHGVMLYRLWKKN